MIRLYTDGSCIGNPGPGGWGAILMEDGRRQELHGRENKRTTNQRMEVMAAIEGLAHAPPGSDVTVYSDSEYLVKTMTKGWKRRANLDLWGRLDSLVAARRVRWEWLAGHVGHPEQERAHHLATGMTGEERPK